MLKIGLDHQLVCHHLAFNSLKKDFTTAPILTHWIPDCLLVVKTEALDYGLEVILSMITLDGELHPIMFHSQTFSSAKLNYDVHDKDLLAIFEAFKHWRHYLEGPTSPIDVVTDHNLEYFSMMKLLTQRQAHWSEYLSQFNCVIWFCPRKLRMKPDTLTR
jgi:hypothetical protein